jgi:zinc transport system substrate-binding protein
MSRLRIAAGLGLTVLCLWPACTESAVEAATSIFPISAIIREVGGENVKITTIVPAGSDPHHFELTPKKAKALHEADVVFVIGGSFDRWMLPAEREVDGTYLLIEFHRAFKDSLIPLGTSFNPHFWLDPCFAKEMTRIVSVALCTVDLPNCDYYRENAEAFIEKLEFLHLTSEERLRQTGFKDYVALHPAWTYFARRYGLSEHNVVEISHEAEPSAKHIAEVVNQMKRYGIRFILAEEFSNLDLVRGVASHTGARIVLLDPLGGEDRPGRDSYVSLISHNISVIEDSTMPVEARR